ncbi:hypothetical protein ACFL6C_09745, partial [Myxococcota bacterium]
MMCKPAKGPFALAILLAAGPALAQAPTLKTIHIEDGSDQAAYDDWAEVLANPSNTTVDGDGTTPALCGPINPTPEDLDCAVAPIGQTGRDLMRFSWTYDWNGDPNTSFVALYVERFETVSTNLCFHFIADTDGPPEMVGDIPYLDPNDKVVTAKYHGGNGLILGSQGPEICDYLPSNGACTDNDPNRDTECDPIANPATGIVDGFNVAGSVSTACTPVPQYCKYLGTECWDLNGNDVCDPVEDTNGGGCDTSDCDECDSGDTDPTSLFEGKRFEIRIPWSDFGATTEPMSLYWHVTVKNCGGGLIGLDNIGGAGDTLGKFGFEDVIITPDFQAGGASSPGTVSYGHLLTSIGTSDALANMSISSSLDLPVDLYRDDDGDGDPTTGTLALMATGSNPDGTFDTVVPGFDWDLDGRPDPGVLLSPSDTFAIATTLTIPPDRNRFTDTTVVTVDTVDGSHAATLSTFIGFVVFSPATVTKYALPDMQVPIPLMVTNLGTVADTINITLDDTGGDDGPYAIALYQDFNCDTIPDDCGGPCPLFDSNGDTIDDIGEVGTDGWNCLVVTVTTPIGGLVGDLERFRVVGTMATDPDKSGFTSVLMGIRDLITVEPASYGSDANPIPLSSADVRYFPFNIIHAGPVSDDFELCVNWSPGADAPYKLRLFSDPNGDGDISDGSVILTFDTSDQNCGGADEQLVTVGPMAEFGGAYPFVMEMRVPLTPPPLSNPLHHIVRVDDRTGGTNNLDSGEVVSNLGKLALFTDATYSVATNHFASCDTVYLRTRDLDDVSQDLYYRVEITNPVPETMCLPNPASCGQHYITNVFGVFEDSYDIPAGKPTGTWTFDLIDDNTGDEDETEEATVENNGTATAPSPTYTDFVRTVGDDVSFTVTLTNNNTGAPFAGSL